MLSIILQSKKYRWNIFLKFYVIEYHNAVKSKTKRRHLFWGKNIARKYSKVGLIIDTSPNNIFTEEIPRMMIHQFDFSLYD